MTTATASEVDCLVNKHPDIVAFGSRSDASDNEWIIKAEERLGLKLTDSYKWFLQNYAGGEIGSEEIFSIYGMDFETVNGGDIVYQHINGVKKGSTSHDELVISETDFGEVFFFDYKTFDAHECKIFLRTPPDECRPYANNFYEFLIKRINAYLS